MVRILFLHPDLGIGGAERLVLDAAIALKRKGHVVSFLTNHFDVKHCFEELKNGTIAVETVGDWLPRKLFGKFYAFCAYFRMIYAALYTSIFISRREKIDLIFCDIISIGIPFLKLAAKNPKIIFYCHFPDQLLSKKGSVIKNLYRIPLDYLEELTTGQAHRVMVNSKFTRRIFRETFKGLSITPDVLYPSINVDYFDHQEADIDQEIILPKESFIFLSINRYERKKNLSLAITSFYQLKGMITRIEWEKCFLVIAGGYDNRVIENVEYYRELNLLATKLGIASKITFLRSPSDRQKLYLLRECYCLLYTPENEHFGIVPLEGMYMSKPIIAVNNGGPTETIIHNSTGFLCEQNEEEFSKAMLLLIRDRHLAERMGEMGRKRVQARFSFEAFAEKLECVVIELLNDI